MGNSNYPTKLEYNKDLVNKISKTLDIQNAGKEINTITKFLQKKKAETIKKSNFRKKFLHRDNGKTTIHNLINHLNSILSANNQDINAQQEENNKPQTTNENYISQIQQNEINNSNNREYINTHNENLLEDFFQISYKLKTPTFNCNNIQYNMNDQDIDNIRTNKHQQKIFDNNKYKIGDDMQKEKGNNNIKTSKITPFIKTINIHNIRSHRKEEIKINNHQTNASPKIKIPKLHLNSILDEYKNSPNNNKINKEEKKIQSKKIIHINTCKNNQNNLNNEFITMSNIVNPSKINEERISPKMSKNDNIENYIEAIKIKTAQKNIKIHYKIKHEKNGNRKEQFSKNQNKSNVKKK